jgi:hypothetical protein
LILFGIMIAMSSNEKDVSTVAAIISAIGGFCLAMALTNLIISPHTAFEGCPIRVSATDRVHMIPRDATNGIMVTSAVDSSGNNILVVEKFSYKTVK